MEAGRFHSGDPALGHHACAQQPEVAENLLLLQVSSCATRSGYPIPDVADPA